MREEETDITIVIVEDQDVKRLALRRSLGSVRGFRVTGEAVDGVTALHKAIDLKPKVVMVDAGLPLMDAIEVVRHLKDQMPDAKVMMMATEGSGIDILAAIGAGANSFFKKCVTNDQLEIAVRTVASGGVWLDATVAPRVLQAAAAGAQSSHSNDFRNKLSPREYEVLSLVVEGYSNHDITAKLCISIETVKTHIRHVIEKLGVHSRTEAAVKAIQEGITGHPQTRDAAH